jgi:hypothetical protein
MSKSSLGFSVLIIILNLYRYFSLMKFLSDKTILKRRFYRSQGYKLDFDKTSTLNEKMQWLKIYDRTKLHTQCADKILVRDFLAGKFGTKHLIPLEYVTSDWKNIVPENMPDFPFIIKPNHGSGWYRIVHDKSKVNWKELQTECRYWLSQNYYEYQREWQYKDIRPMIMVEKLLISKGGNIPTNFRVHCIHGRVELIALTIYLGNDTENYRNLKFNREWEYLDFDWADRKTNLSTLRFSEEYPKPFSLEKIICFAEEVSRHFKYVRVDFYENDNELYHGEITFHDGGGFERITPFEWDEKLGELIDLNKAADIY